MIWWQPFPRAARSLLQLPASLCMHTRNWKNSLIPLTSSVSYLPPQPLQRRRLPRQSANFTFHASRVKPACMEQNLKLSYVTKWHRKPLQENVPIGFVRKLPSNLTLPEKIWVALWPLMLLPNRSPICRWAVSLPWILAVSAEIIATTWSIAWRHHSLYSTCSYLKPLEWQDQDAGCYWRNHRKY